MAKLLVGASLGATFLLAAAVPVVSAQQVVEGIVVRTTLTACEFKPGSCEGTAVLERKTSGKAEQVTIKVPKGTQIKHGSEHLFLPGLKVRLVAVTYVEDKGEKVATSIDVKAPKP
jgi:hypothetical protein